MDVPAWLELRKFVSPEFVFGEGALRMAGQYARNFGAARVLVVSDKGVCNAGWTGAVIESLEAEGLQYSIFTDVTPNPRAEEVMRGAELYKSECCDVIVAVGGGSPMDCAKGIGVVSVNGKNILDYTGVDRIPLPGPPLICVPTTGGTSADISQFAIITDRKKSIKTALVSKTLVPDTSLIDPATTRTMPPELTANTGIDAFTHGIEAYVSNACSPVTDLFALDAVGLIFDNLIPVKNEPDNREYRGKIMLGSLEAGLAFSNASLGLAHAMSHSLGGFVDNPHGESEAILLPHVIGFNYDAVPGRFDKIGEMLGLDLAGLGHDRKKSALIDTLIRFFIEMGFNRTLRQLGVKEDDIPGLARNALDDVCLVTNPRPVRLDDIVAIYEKAL
jgi:alcohol dehydrogenase class IV